MRTFCFPSTRVICLSPRRPLSYAFLNSSVNYLLIAMSPKYPPQVQRAEPDPLDKDRDRDRAWRSDLEIEIGLRDPTCSLKVGSVSQRLPSSISIAKLDLDLQLEQLRSSSWREIQMDDSS
jgi:hypothetical protein